MRRYITARIMDEEDGLREIKNVTGIRIKDKKYVLLIMEDYVPSLGAIDGNVTIITDDEKGETFFNNIQGFYKHQHNVFTLLIKNRNTEAQDTAQ